MLLFRSEEHVAKWCKDWGFAQGAILKLSQCWQLAQAWYSADRRDPNWRRFTVGEAHALFSRLGLTGTFWRLS